jgi:hypothetical protein
LAKESSIKHWEIEQIPDDDLLHYRVQKAWIVDGSVIPGAFRDREGAMSVDWNKYSTPAESRNRAKKPNDNAIVSFVASDLRKMAKQTVSHSPNQPLNNRAHSDVIGEKDEEARLIMSRSMKWAIKLT